MPAQWEPTPADGEWELEFGSFRVLLYEVTCQPGVFTGHLGIRLFGGSIRLSATTPAAAQAEALALVRTRLRAALEELE